MKYLFPTLLAAASLACSGAASAHDEPEHEGPPPFEYAISKLPSDKAEMFRATMEQAHDKNAPLMEQMHSLHDELHAIVTAPKFDKDAFLAKHQEIGKLEEKIHTNMSEGMASAFSQLTAEQRKTVSAAMHHKHHEHGSHQHMGKAHSEHDEADSPSSKTQ